FHPANRGAVWYRATLKPPKAVSGLELFAFINEEMEKEGVTIRAESAHNLFPQRPVQTCHGILGKFGEHPSRICAYVSFGIHLGRRPDAELTKLVQDCLEAGLASYIGLYGDKTKITDPATENPMVARHYALGISKRGFVVQVYGAAGHMGAIRERDGAITKAAHLIRSLVGSKPRIESLAGGPITLVLRDEAAEKTRGQSATAPGGSVDRAPENGCPLILEGGQGFVPTHTMKEVMQRLRAAAERGAENFLRRMGRLERGSDVVAVAYEKLHNEAFDGDPNSESVRHAIKAARACGIWKDEPILGWTVSCDARLFASQYPGMEVLTFGPGRLIHAHSDQEQIDLKELRQGVEFLALFALLQTGSIKPQ
ncbi:MAG TPA: M20/M25/M40 family metallo-hydrolase, partial [Verrucomicrobiae bacterium]|nr:M20/M25/M40 family metallo-hydrolase [Verrucomicrobiae bacterium]